MGDIGVIGVIGVMGDNGVVGVSAPASRTKRVRSGAVVVILNGPPTAPFLMTALLLPASKLSTTMSL